MSNPLCPPHFRHLPQASRLSDAAALQARFSAGRGARHVIVVGSDQPSGELYFVVAPAEAQQLYAAGMQPLWLR